MLRAFCEPPQVLPNAADSDTDIVATASCIVKQVVLLPPRHIVATASCDCCHSLEQLPLAHHSIVAELTTLPWSMFLLRPSQFPYGSPIMQATIVQSKPT